VGAEDHPEDVEAPGGAPARMATAWLERMSALPVQSPITTRITERLQRKRKLATPYATV
jgi:hypothetical protein